MFNIDIKLLAALAPAILCTLLLAGCYLPRLATDALARLGKDEFRLEWWYHVVLHAAFYGSVLNVILGVDSHSVAGEVITASWFVACLWFSRLLGKRLSSLRATEHEEDHSRLVSSLRSALEAELRAQALRQVDGSKNQD